MLIVSLSFPFCGELNPQSNHHQKFKIPTNGTPFGLKFETDSTASFCDKEGGKIFNLETGKTSKLSRQCQPDDEANRDCSDSSLEIVVRRPGLGPVDIVDVGAFSYVIDPHVTDCAVDEKSISILSPSSVTRIDTKLGISYKLDSQGGNRIITRKGYSIWSTDSEIRTGFEWKIYLLPRIGIQGCYPSEIFSEKISSTSSDTEKTFFANGAILHVYGSILYPKSNLKNEYTSSLKAHSSNQSQITYKIFKKDWFVISGTTEKNIFYQKSKISDKSLTTWEITYEKSRKQIYDQLVTQLVPPSKSM